MFAKALLFLLISVLQRFLRKKVHQMFVKFCVSFFLQKARENSCEKNKTTNSSLKFLGK
jgi:hypothetical protein